MKHIEAMAQAMNMQSALDEFDLTKQAQAAYDALMDSVPDLVWEDNTGESEAYFLGIEYIVAPGDDGFGWDSRELDSYADGFDSLEAAKAAANTHHKAEVAKIWGAG